MNIFIKRILLAGLVLTAVVAPVQEAKAGIIGEAMQLFSFDKMQTRIWHGLGFM